jgi:hypothetical protein
MAFTVRGNLKDPKHIELEEPVPDVQGPVEVTVRPIEGEQKVPLFESLSAEEWINQFHEWLDSHDPNLPVLPDEALRRESIYDDRL